MDGAEKQIGPAIGGNVTFDPLAAALPVDDPAIREALDCDIGEFVDAKAWIGGQRYEELIAQRVGIRERLYEKPRFRCSLCSVPVYLVANQLKHFFFRHITEDGSCPAETRSALSRDEILARKYDGVRESEPHKRIKALIVRSLSADPSFSEILSERQWRSSHDERSRRQPDVQANGPLGRTAFEVQLSTTFLDVVAGRRSFYKQEGALLVWVMGNFDPEYRRLTTDDLLFTNNSNILVVDEETATLSEAECQFYVRCHFRRPMREGDRLTDRWESCVVPFDAKRHAYDPDEIARGGVFVVLSHDGEARIERGFIRAEDGAPEPEEVEDGESVIDGVRVNGDGEIMEDGDESGDDISALEREDEEAEEDGKPLSDSLIRDLTAHRTLALRLALGEQPDMALIAVTHALAAQTFYRGGGEAHCLEIRPISASLGGHADGIEDMADAKALADRHAGWATDMPRDVADLWGFIAGLDHASVMALFAHCASLTVNTVKQPWEQNKRRAHKTADKLATAVALDMTAHWTPTVRAYLGRVTKAQILAAVREALGDGAAERIAEKKKQEMAETAEQLLAGTGWLPSLLRTEQPAWLTDAQPEISAMAKDMTETHSTETVEDEPFAVAAE